MQGNLSCHPQKSQENLDLDVDRAETVNLRASGMEGDRVKLLNEIST